MRHQTLRVLAATVAALLASGCATDTAMREVAGSSAALVNQFKLASQSFVVRMNDLNDSDTVRLRRLAGNTQAMQIEAAAAETAWSAIADKEALTMYGALSKSRPNDVIAGSAVLKSLNTETDTTPITADAKQFDSLVQKLNALAAAPTLPVLLESWLKYGKAVNDILQADMKAAGTALEATKGKAAVQTKNALPAAKQ